MKITLKKMVVSLLAFIFLVLFSYVCLSYFSRGKLYDLSLGPITISVSVDAAYPDRRCNCNQVGVYVGCSGGEPKIK